LNAMVVDTTKEGCCFDGFSQRVQMFKPRIPYLPLVAREAGGGSCHLWVFW